MSTKTVFLFPGQGSQSVGMGRDLAQHFAAARRTFEEADDALGYSLSRLCFEGPAEQLKRTEYTQPAIFAVSVAALRVLEEGGLRPDLVAGHSLGEYSACVAAGVLRFSDAIRALRLRGLFMQEAVPEGQGAMAAVLGLNAAAVVELCEATAEETGEVVSPANLNSPEQVVIAGNTEAVSRASRRAKELGAKKVVPLQVSAPFHCALMQPAEDQLAEVLGRTEFHDAWAPVVANATAAITSSGAEERQNLVRQVTAPVRWMESMRALIEQGAATFLEVGPGKVLTGLLRQIDREQQCSPIENTAAVEKILGAAEVSESQIA